MKGSSAKSSRCDINEGQCKTPTKYDINLSKQLEGHNSNSELAATSLEDEGESEHDQRRHID